MSASLTIPVAIASNQPGVPLRFPEQQLFPMLISGGMPTLPGYVFRLNHLLKTEEPDMAAVCGVMFALILTLRSEASLNFIYFAF